MLLEVTFDLTGLLPIKSHYCLYCNGIPEFVRKRSMLTVKQLKQRKIFEMLLSGSRIYKKWQTSAIIREISDSNLETGRNGSKNLESPRLFERVDIPGIVLANNFFSCHHDKQNSHSLGQ